MAGVVTSKKGADSREKPPSLPVHGQIRVQLDPEDYERFRGYRWSVLQNAGRVYIRRGAGLREYGKPETILLSHEIAGAEPGQRVRHRDGNPFNFHRRNLAIEEGERCKA